MTPERPRPDLDQTREALRRHDERAEEPDEEHAEAEAAAEEEVSCGGEAPAAEDGAPDGSED